MENILRKYKNKKDDTDKQKTYRYIHFYNPETKQTKRVTESQWLCDKEEVIKYNKEETERQSALQEIWNHIFEFIANHKTTEKLFNSDSIEYKSENNAKK
jgi:hypothetical protein